MMEPCKKCGRMDEDYFGPGLCLACQNVQEKGSKLDEVAADLADIATIPSSNPDNPTTDDLPNFPHSVPSAGANNSQPE